MDNERKIEAPQPHTQLTHAIGTDRAIIMGDPGAGGYDCEAHG